MDPKRYVYRTNRYRASSDVKPSQRLSSYSPSSAYSSSYSSSPPTSYHSSYLSPSSYSSSLPSSSGYSSSLPSSYYSSLNSPPHSSTSLHPSSSSSSSSAYSSLHSSPSYSPPPYPSYFSPSSPSSSSAYFSSHSSPSSSSPLYSSPSSYSPTFSHSSPSSTSNSSSHSSPYHSSRSSIPSSSYSSPSSPLVSSSSNSPSTYTSSSNSLSTHYSSSPSTLPPNSSSTFSSSLNSPSSFHTPSLNSPSSSSYLSSPSTSTASSDSSSSIHHYTSPSHSSSSTSPSSHNSHSSTYSSPTSTHYSPSSSYPSNSTSPHHLSSSSSSHPSSYSSSSSPSSTSYSSSSSTYISTPSTPSLYSSSYPSASSYTSSHLPPSPYHPSTFLDPPPPPLSPYSSSSHPSSYSSTSSSPSSTSYSSSSSTYISTPSTSSLYSSSYPSASNYTSSHLYPSPSHPSTFLDPPPPLSPYSSPHLSSSYPSAPHLSTHSPHSSSSSPYTSSLYSLPSYLRASCYLLCSSSSPPGNHHHHEVLNERKLLQVMETCKAENSHLRLIRVLGEVYSSPENLGNSFLKSDSPPAQPLEPSQLANMTKEDVRQLECEKEKDEDCSEECSAAAAGGCHHQLESGSDQTAVDLDSVRRAYSQLFTLFGSLIESALVLALITLSNYIEVDLRMGFVLSPRDGSSSRLINKQPCSLETLLNALVIALEIPTLGTNEYLEVALPKLCRAASYLPLSAQARLARVWSRHSAHKLRSLLEALQQLITLRVIIVSRDFSVQNDEAITAPTKLMKIIYYASLLAGDLDSPELREDDSAAGCSGDLPWGPVLPSHKSFKQPHVDDPLAEELKVNVLDCRQPLIPFTDFYNEPLSDVVEMDKDFANYKNHRGGDSADRSSAAAFSFMRYAFVLTPATKTLALYYDNRIRMYTERRISFLQNVVGQPANPYLRLKVRRDHIIDDALVELEMVAMENPKDLKKQLVVEFEGEQGIDEGGVSKEFFQLIVEEIFNPDFSMFTYQQDSRTVWFNTSSFESNAQFTLIGIVLGLAIYNNIILDVHFPMVVYKKLMGKKGMYHDLEDFNPTLYNSLKALLEYEGDDMEDTFMQTFRVGYTDVFGSSLTHELKPNGDKIFVNQQNKREFVDLYADFLLNTSIEKQFNAFKKGFQMVTDESPLHLLFRPEEVEQLVCGSKKFDLRELEEATEYDGGYTVDSAVVKHFWQIAHALPADSQRKLLQFATGSDRVPVGGLSKLKLIIAKNGPDSDRLPTAHTCFNVLLLPEYDSKDKLYDRLLKAINYSKGFGML